MALWDFDLEKCFLNRVQDFRYENLQQFELKKRIW